jgi:hypothetical protein
VPIPLSAAILSLLSPDNHWFTTCFLITGSIAAAIAHDRHFSYQNENDLVDFIASEMQNEGLDPNNEENIYSYLNTKFM